MRLILLKIYRSTLGRLLLIWKKSPKKFQGGEEKTGELSSVEIARRLVGRSVVLRKSEQSINFPLIVTSSLFIIGVPALWLHLLTSRVNASSESYSVRATARAEGTVSYDYFNEPTLTSMPWQHSGGPAATSTPWVAPSATSMPWVAPTSTSTPWVAPSATSTPWVEYYTAGYSYYFPDLGGVNCGSGNWDGVHCADVTASGMGWRAYVGTGVAVPPRWMAYVGFGTVIRVVEPETIAGDYVIVDLCTACDAGYWPDNRERIDFLDTKQRLSWGQELTFYFLSSVAPSSN